MAATKVKALKIRSVKPHFYRAGRRWTREAQVVLASEFSTTQIKALMDEPHLAVSEVVVDGADTAEAQADKAKADKKA